MEPADKEKPSSNSVTIGGKKFIVWPTSQSLKDDFWSRQETRMISHIILLSLYSLLVTYIYANAVIDGKRLVAASGVEFILAIFGGNHFYAIVVFILSLWYLLLSTEDALGKVTDTLVVFASWFLIMEMVMVGFGLFFGWGFFFTARALTVGGIGFSLCRIWRERNRWKEKVVSGSDKASHDDAPPFSRQEKSDIIIEYIGMALALIIFAYILFQS